MRVVIAAYGLEEDVLPLVGLGRVLRLRGHDVHLVTHRSFAAVVESAGLHCAPIGRAWDLWKLRRCADPWHLENTKLPLEQRVLRPLTAMRDAVMALHVPGRTVLVADALALGAKIAADQLSIPTVNVHLHPTSLRWLALPWPAAIEVDLLLGPVVNAARAGVGLEPVYGILSGGWRSARWDVCAFPGWFMPPELAQPANIVMGGFLQDESSSRLNVVDGVAVHDGTWPEAVSAMASGLPQVVTPKTTRDSDVAALLARLGVATVVAADNRSRQTIAAATADVARSDKMRQRCRLIAARVERSNGTQRICGLIEALPDSATSRPMASSSRERRDVLVLAFGTHGDVHPSVGVAKALRERGHHVTFASFPCYELMIRRAGLNFLPLGTLEHFHRLVESPEVWHPERGPVYGMLNGIVPMIGPAYELLLNHYREGMVVLASNLCMGARVAQDAIGFSMLTTHISPSSFYSSEQRPDDPFDAAALPGLNAFRARVGLAAVNEPVRHWWQSPDRVIGLFPGWFAAPTPDWPAQARTSGFPMFDERESAEMSADLMRFLDAGEPPVVFTIGTGMWHGSAFFATAAEALAATGRRGILLTRHAAHLPDKLSRGVEHFEYAPFSQLLPRCAGIVHHGGIGTSAQALAAGIPQLLMPMTWDQPENALRLMALGVGDALLPDQFTAAAVAPAIDGMYRSKPLKARCAAFAARFALERPLEMICEMVEAMPTSRSSAPSPRELGAITRVGATGAETDGMAVAAAAAGG